MNAVVSEEVDAAHVSPPRPRWRSGRRFSRWFLLAALVVAVEIAYLFLVTAGTFSNWPTYTENYDLQAEGFRSGHLYLSVEPAPELLTKKNPFDPANRPLWFWDMSLYKGHYYLYWGPFPAVVLAAVKSAFRLSSTIGDQYLLFGFYSIYLLSGALLIERMARRIFPTVPFYLVVVSILVLALVNPNPYMLATAGVYQTAIAGGQAFLLLGLVFAFDSVWQASMGEPGLVRLLLAGSSWAIAIACRFSLGPPVFLLTLTTVLLSWRGSGRPRASLIRDSVALAAPVALSSSLLLLYNKVRFDSWFEFGLRLQVSTMQFRTQLSYVAANVYSYLLRPMTASCTFPFIKAPWDTGAAAFPRGFTMQPGYWASEPVAGLLLAVPWCWFIPVGAFLGIRAGVRALASRGGVVRPGISNASLWCAVAFTIIGTLPMLPVAGLFIATMRYMVDAIAGIVLFSTWSAWSLYARARCRWLRLGVVSAISVLAITTIALGSMLGYEGYSGQIRVQNPALHDRIVRALSPHCE